MNRLAHTIDIFVQLSNAYEGRDKIVKIVQYLAKFLAWYHLKRNAKLSITYLNISDLCNLYVNFLDDS